MIILPFLSFGQVIETFSDGNFTANPIWTGAVSNFTVNANFELQSKATATSVSYLFTPSEAIDSASWECRVKVNYSTSSSNYACVYIISDKNDLTAGCNGYYVQIGGTNDEVSLFLQQGTQKTKIIDGADKRTDGSSVDIRVKVTRDTEGNFKLYSKLASETDFVLEGTATNSVVTQSKFFGLLYSNTSTTGSDYYFDDILVTGSKAVDAVAPLWTSFKILLPDKLQLKFSEAMNFRNATFEVDNGIGKFFSKTVSEDSTAIELTFSNAFEKGILYILHTQGLTDLSGNSLLLTSKSFGIIEPLTPNDLVFNEVMFDNPLNSVEYVEVYNKSEKVLDLSNLIFTTRKSDGTFNAGNKIPLQTIILPHAYLVLSENADSLRNYHHVPLESMIITMPWTSLNNTSSDLVLLNEAKDTVYDELIYDTKWHNMLIKNTKGVALEKINPSLEAQDPQSWHSASSETNYGTPGYKNSQFRDLQSEENSSRQVWVDPEAFSPDNDGQSDVCFIRYKTEMNGYAANVLILNPAGVKVRQLASNILLSTEGFLTWDGLTDQGKNVNVGIYVLYFEMFNPLNGNRKQFKMPVVVSAR
jgi:hypothetical protein